MQVLSCPKSIYTPIQSNKSLPYMHSAQKGNDAVFCSVQTQRRIREAVELAVQQ